MGNRQWFACVLAEALDWVSRDQADVATLSKQLQFASVRIVTLAEGEISELQVGLKGTMNARLLTAHELVERVCATFAGPVSEHLTIPRRPPDPALRRVAR